MKQGDLKKAIEVESSRCVCADGKLRLELSLANRSANPLFFVPRVRSVELDRQSKTLHLWFCDRRLASCADDRKVGLRRCFSVPAAAPIEGRSVKKLAIELPAVLTQLHVGPGGEVSFEGLDLGRATKARLHFAFDDKPIYLDPKTDARDQSRAWGLDFEATTKIESPQPSRR